MLIFFGVSNEKTYRDTYINKIIINSVLLQLNIVKRIKKKFTAEKNL